MMVPNEQMSDDGEARVYVRKRAVAALSQERRLEGRVGQREGEGLAVGRRAAMRRAPMYQAVRPNECGAAADGQRAYLLVLLRDYGVDVGVVRLGAWRVVH